MKLDQKTIRIAVAIAASILVIFLSIAMKSSLPPPRDMFGYRVPDTTHWRMRLCRKIFTSAELYHYLCV